MFDNLYHAAVEASSSEALLQRALKKLINREDETLTDEELKALDFHVFVLYNERFYADEQVPF